MTTACTTTFLSTTTITTTLFGKGKKARHTEPVREPAGQPQSAQQEVLMITNIEIIQGERIRGQMMCMTGHQARAQTPTRHSTTLADAAIALVWLIINSTIASQVDRPRRNQSLSKKQET